MYEIVATAATQQITVIWELAVKRHMGLAMQRAAHRQAIQQLHADQVLGRVLKTSVARLLDIAERRKVCPL